MSWITDLLLGKNTGEVVSKPVEAVGNVLDKLFTSKDEKLTHEEIRMRLMMQPDIAQVELNKIEAKHRTIFVAGWRPFIGWVGGMGFAINFIVRPLFNYVLLVKYPDVPIMVSLDMGALSGLLAGMLGFGGMRTYEKLKGISK
jgi:hypothetical protein